MPAKADKYDAVYIYMIIEFISNMNNSNFTISTGSMNSYKTYAMHNAYYHRKYKCFLFTGIPAYAHTGMLVFLSMKSCPLNQFLKKSSHLSNYLAIFSVILYYYRPKEYKSLKELSMCAIY